MTVIALLLFLTVAGLLYYQNSLLKKQLSSLTISSTSIPIYSSPVAQQLPTPNSFSDSYPTPTPVDTTSWKYFISQSNGFSLRYPPQWNLGLVSNGISLTLPPNPNCLPPHVCGGVEPGPIFILLESNLKSYSLDNFAIFYLKKRYPEITEPDYFNIPIDYFEEEIRPLINSGISKSSIVVKHLPGECGEVYLFISRLDKILVMDFNCIDMNILSTFHFLN